MKNPQPTKREAQQWADALRSGAHRQGQGELQLPDMRVCCLGVACLIFIPEEKQEKTEQGRLMYHVPSTQPNAPEWLKRINQDLRSRLGVKFSALNDYYSYTFNEIADILELVYVHKALPVEIKEEDNEY